MIEGLKESNPYCVFVFKHHNVTVAHAREPDVVFRTNGKCKFQDCEVQVRVTVDKAMEATATYSGSVKHNTDEVNSRNISGKVRRDMRDQFRLGSLPMKIFVDRLGHLEEGVYESGNRDTSSCNLQVFQKISSESRTTLRKADNELESLMELQKCLRSKYPGTVPGLIQKIVAKPFYVICFTEKGVRTFHKRAGDTVLHWDATGGCCGSSLSENGKKLLYYELCIGGKGPTLPLAWMISEDHSEPTILDWIHVFRTAERKIFGHSNLCIPKLICSDRAWVFLLGTIKNFNCDNLNRFMERTWRIVHCEGSDQDFRHLTVPHACASHFMKSIRNLTKTHIVIVLDFCLMQLAY